jgi:hypothetical protein
MFEARVKTGLAQLYKGSPQPLTQKKRIEKLKRYIRDWCAAFRLCDGIVERRAYWLAQVKWAV